jgi:3-hydroxybutyryl-CoA dehydratase
VTGFVRGLALPERQFPAFEAQALAAYALLSGDDNDLHTDRAVAARFGLRDCPVHGLAIMALIEPYLLGWRADVTVVASSLRFERPIFRGQAIRLSGRIVAVAPGGREATLRLLVHDPDGRPACVGEATVRVAEQAVSPGVGEPAAC